MSAGFLGRFGFSALEVREMAIDPVTPEILYVGVTSAGMFKSTDGAHSWVKANQGMPANDDTITALAVAPSSPATLFAGTSFNRVYRSTDAAGSWQTVVDGEFGRVDALAVAPSNSSIIYLGAGFDMIYKSTNGGDTWNSVSTGLAGFVFFNQITIHPTNPDIVYGASGGGLFKTTNGGNSWAMLNTPETQIESVVLDPSNPLTVYAGSVFTVLKSTNGGNSWVKQDDDLFAQVIVNSMAIDPGDPLTLYAGGHALEALFKSTDGGTTWAVSNSGLRNFDIRSIAFDLQNPLTIYTAADVGGVHKSTDGGQTWEAKRDSTLHGFVDILDIVVDPVNPANVYLGTDLSGGIFWSDDGAETWNAANALGTAYELGFHPTNPSTLYAASGDGTVYKSTNQARDWIPSGNGLPNTVEYTALAVDPSDGMTVYTGSRPRIGSPETAGIYKTTDGGATWAEANTGFEITFEVRALEIDPTNPSTLYAGGFGGIRQKSTDGAGSWVTLNTGIPQVSRVTSVAIDPVNSSVVYAGTTLSGVYKSEDGGTTWAEFSQGLPSEGVLTLEINPADPKRVYAASRFSSVFRYESISPQWLFAAGDPAEIGGLFDGVALSNYSGLGAGVTLEAIGDSTSGKAGPADHSTLQPLGANQMVDLNLPAGEQFADLRENIFPAILKTLPAWIELTSDNSDIASFFQFGSGTLTQLDGGVAIENLATKFFFQRIFDGPSAFRGQAATTRLTVLNPGDEPVTVDLNYFPPQDGPLGQARQATRKIPARSFLDEKASDVFGTSISGGYVAGEVTAGGGVAAFELVQLSDRPMVLGLNASTDNSSTRSFSAQLASRPDVFTNVNVINTSAASRDVELTAVRTDGGIEGDPVKVTLAAGAQFSADASQIFGFGVASAAAAGLQGGAFVGSLEVVADGDGVVGDVIFGDPGEVGFAASLSLQSEPFTEAVFSQFADIPGLFFTGLAFYYPGNIGSSPQGGAPDTEITIEVILASGESVGESSFKLLPGELIDKSISDLAPDAAGKANGYILVTSTQPLIAQVVFVALGGGGISLFSAVPPKVIR